MTLRTVPSSTTYFTVADSRYFLGAVALVNSLVLTDHEGTFVVVDTGLEPWQRERLSGVATVSDVRWPPGLPPAFFKAHIAPQIPGDVIVYLDSDMIVTDSLADVVSLAAAGRFCAAPDNQSHRYFPEWRELLGLAHALRRQTYVNAGFFALAPGRWPRFFERWQAVCDAVIRVAPPMHTMSFETALEDPSAFHDQDALNALLMSEVSEDALALINSGRVAATDELPSVVCVDPRTLTCTLDGRRTLILHYLNAPKPWVPSGWITTSNNAYVRLLERLLAADDVPIQVGKDELPVWLRSTGIRRGALFAGIRGVRAASHAVPASLRSRLRAALSRR
jgi:hypothetical protein